MAITAAVPSIALVGDTILSHLIHDLVFHLSFFCIFPGGTLYLGSYLFLPKPVMNQGGVPTLRIALAEVLFES
jgi:hypothetical protein